MTLNRQSPFVLFSLYMKNDNGVDPEPTGYGGSNGVGMGITLTVSTGTPPTRTYMLKLSGIF